MPNLIKRNSDSGDWESVADDNANDARAWQSLENWKNGDPLLLQVDEEPLPEHAEASAIAINFPAFNDGRGLSLGVLLRTRIQFPGELRAIGEVHQDVLHYMVRCGFNAFELDESKDLDTALNLISPYSDHYQASILQPAPAYRRVQRG